MDTEIIKIILALMVLINPFAALSLFLDMTKGYTTKNRRKTAQVACLSIFVTITFFTMVGEILLTVLGISIGSFQVAGGILVFLIALNMLNGEGNPVKPDENANYAELQDMLPSMASAVVPLAFPMMIGPGGISTVIIYASQTPDLLRLGFIVVAGAFISVFCYLTLMAATSVSKFLGETGLNILNRVMGMLLAAVAIEIVISGLKNILPDLMG